MNLSFSSNQFLPVNRAFLYGDSVAVSFFVRNGQLIMAEECYFFLMASMRKMRMAIPLSYTLEFFQSLFEEQVLSQGIHNAVIRFYVYRNSDCAPLHRSDVSYYADVMATEDICGIQGDYVLDLIKEININSNLLSGIQVHCPENIYADIYARENGLDEVILLNPQKRIARSTSGNLLFLEGDTVKIPKQSEGAYISPLLENFVTYLHKQRVIRIEEAEMIAFESQKAEEILLISDLKGIFHVTKIRNKSFGKNRFAGMIDEWRAQVV